MVKVTLQGKIIHGMSIRTTNTDEMDPEFSKIAGLWDRFYEKIAPSIQERGSIYGVYYNYESDMSGRYSVLAGSDEIQSIDAHLEQVMIQSGDYLVFSGTGDIPEVVMKIWAQIWDYFSRDDAPYQRAYTTDFERYKRQNDIEIYIAVT
jgi:predicted transcriptional regulator YdeE